jgi:hypothetical protein
MTRIEKVALFVALTVALVAFVAMRDFSRSEAVIAFVLTASVALIAYLTGRDHRKLREP